MENFELVKNNLLSVEFNLPARFAGYLINGDIEGYEDEELKKLDDFLTRNNAGRCLSAEVENSSFYYRNDFNNIGDDCCMFSFTHLSGY